MKELLINSQKLPNYRANLKVPFISLNMKAAISLFVLIALLLCFSLSYAEEDNMSSERPPYPYDYPEHVIEDYDKEIDLYNDYGWDILLKFGIFFIVAGGCIAFFYFYRSTRIVIHWARSNKFRIVSIKIPLNPGPLWMHTVWPWHQMIYYATVRTRQNELKSAWVLCGNRWVGIFSNHVVVEWDQIPDRVIGIKMPFVSD